MSKQVAFEFIIEGLNNELTKVAELEKALFDNKEMLKLFKKEGADFTGILKEQAKLKQEYKQVQKAISDTTKEFNKQAAAGSTEAQRQVQIAKQSKQIAQEEKAQRRQEVQDRKDLAAQKKKNFEEAIQNNEVEKKSLVGMRIELERMKKEYSQLSDLQRNAVGGKQFLRSIQLQDKKVSGIEQSMGVHGRNVGNYPQGLGMIASNMSGGILGNGATMGYVAVAGAAVSLVNQIVSLNSEIDGLQANIRKTTGLNAEAVERLTERLKGLDTQTTLKELLEIAKIAGRFGINGEQAVGDFTEAVNLLNVALGDNFSGGAEQITTDVSKMSTVLYGASENGTVLADRFTHLGNVINILDNYTNATADQIVDATIRFGPLARALGITADQTIGLSAGFLDMGINVERGSGAMIRFNSVIRTKLKEVSAQIGVSQKDFKELLNTKPVDAMILVITKLKEQFGDDKQGMIAAMKKMGLGGVNLQELFLTMGNNLGRFNDIMDVSAEGIKTINSLNAEQANQLDSLPAQWDRLGNTIAEFTANKSLQEWLKDNTRSLADFFSIMDNEKPGEKFSGNYFFGGLFAKLTQGTPLEQKFLDEMKAARDKAISGLSAQNFTGTDILGRPLPSQPAPIESLLSPDAGKKKKKGKVLTPEELEDIKKKAEALQKERDKAAKKAAMEAAAKGDPGSISFISKEISDFEAKLAKVNPNDTKKFQAILEKVKELNKELEKAKTNADFQKALNDFDDRINFLISDPQSIESKTFDSGPLKSIKDTDEDRMSNAIEIANKTNEAIKKNTNEFNDDADKLLKEQQEDAKNVYISSAQDTANALLDVWANYNQRKLDNDLAAINIEYEAKLKAVQGNTTLEVALQKEQAEKIAAVEKKAAKEAQKLAILQANINGALAVLGSLKSGVNPYSIAMAIAAGAATATQIAIIKSQKFAVGGMGKLPGGYTGPGHGNADETGFRVAGVVHEDEYVAPKSQVERYPSLFQSLERDRLSKLKGFAFGGFAPGGFPMQILPKAPINAMIQERSNIEMARMVAKETGDAVYIATIAASKETNRVAERESFVQKNLNR